MTYATAGPFEVLANPGVLIGIIVVAAIIAVVVRWRKRTAGGRTGRNSRP